MASKMLRINWSCGGHLVRPRPQLSQLALQSRISSTSSSHSFKSAASRPLANSFFLNTSRIPRRIPHHKFHTSQPSKAIFFGHSSFRARHPYVTFCAITPVVIVGSVGIVIAGLLAYDSTTYRHRHKEHVPIHPLALHPQRGGPKNLPIAEHLLNEDEDVDGDGKVDDNEKPRLVIIGGGWGGVSILKSLDPEKYKVTVIAPDNYMLFHPLLPSATVGTVEVRSLVEPLRKIVARVKGQFLQARVVDIDMGSRLIEVEGLNGEGNFYVPYHKAVLAVGSVSNTHGVPGLENCFQLKTIPDVLAIRRRIIENIERAALPSTEEEERKRLLSFVVCGGGPTGVEMAGELFDFVNEDLMDFFPRKLREDISIHIIQSRDHILNTYSEKISKYAEAMFDRNEIDTILNARVKEVRPDKVIYTTKVAPAPTTSPPAPASSSGAKPKLEEHEIPAGFVLWSTGIAMNPLTQKVAAQLPNQYHKHALEVDSHLRVLGAPKGTLYAVGDCATVETNLVDHLLDLVEKCDEDKDGKIDFREFEIMMKRVKKLFPASQKHFAKIRNVFEAYDKDKNNTLGLNELAEMFASISRKITSLPATAQTASQQGKYLGKKFNKLARQHEVLLQNDINDDVDDTYYKPFAYNHLGSLAYLGNSAVFDFGEGWDFAGGLVAMYLWRSVYWSEQVSMRTRMLLMLDWVKRGIWGRDVSKF